MDSSTYIPRKRPRTGRAYNVTPYSILAFHPAAPIGRSYIEWYAWDDWARKMELLDKHGEPSLSKIKMLVKHHVLSATVSKCILTFHSYHPLTGEPIYRQQSRIVVTARCPEQEDWDKETWQELYRGLFGRSQANKAKGKRRK